MRLYIFKHKEENRYCGIAISEDNLQEIITFKKKDFLNLISTDLFEPEKEFKRFFKDLQKGLFFEKELDLNDLGDLHRDLNIKFFPIEEALTFLFRLSLTWKPVDPYRYLFIGDIPF